VRVFISSTFLDMEAERDYLVRFVFPRLREELLSRHIHLIDVDLRWGVTDADVTRVCREAIDECRPRFLCMLGGRYGWTPPDSEVSIVEQEIRHALRDETPVADGAWHHRFYFRAEDATAAARERVPGEFREPAGSPAEWKLRELKDWIRSSGHPVAAYPARWDPEAERFVDLATFGDRVRHDLLASIDAEFPPASPPSDDEFSDEASAMETFVEERAAYFVAGERRRYLEILTAFAQADRPAHDIIILTGDSGSGKSALLARLYREYTAAHPEDLVVAHFAGTSRGSTDLRRTLRRLCYELQSFVEGTTPDGPNRIPVSVQDLILLFPRLLAQAAANFRRVVLIFDAVNQLDPTDNAYSMRWLPVRFPRNLRAIVSSLPHPALSALTHRARVGQAGPAEFEHAGGNLSERSADRAAALVTRAVEWLARAIPARLVGSPGSTAARRFIVLPLDPLSRRDAAALLDHTLARFGKELTSEQRHALLEKPGSGSPLYLIAALEELRTLGQYDLLTARIAALPDDIRPLFLWIFRERLPSDPGFRGRDGQLVGARLTRRLLSCLGVSRLGLSQREIVDLLDPGDEQGNVAALLRLMRPYMMRRGELLAFSHQQAREAAEVAYLREEQERLDAHRTLADYFEERWQREIRAVAELPFHQIGARLWERNAGSLCSLAFVETKCAAGRTGDLLADYDLAVRALSVDQGASVDIDGATAQRLAEFGRWVRASAHVLAAEPWLTFQSAANQPDGTGPAQAAWQQLLSGTKQRPWMRWLNKPQTSGQCISTLAELGGPVVACAATPDGGRLVAVLEDGDVRFWDAVTGSEGVTLTVDVKAGRPWGGLRRSVFVPPDRVLASRGVTAVAISPDGLLLATGTRYGRIYLWDTVTGLLSLELSVGAVSAVTSVAFSPGDGIYLAAVAGPMQTDTGGGASRALIWEVSTGRILRTLLKKIPTFTFSSDAANPPLRACGWDADGQFLLVGSADLQQHWLAPRRRRWGGRPDRVKKPERSRGSTFTAWSVAPAARRVAWGTASGTVIQQDPATGAIVSTVAGHQGRVTACAYSPNGRLLATTSEDLEVRVWDALTGELWGRFAGHTLAPQCCAFSPDGSRLLTGGRDRSLRVWDVRARTEERQGSLKEPAASTLTAHRRRVRAAAFAPDGSFLVSASEDGLALRWDTSSGVVTDAAAYPGDALLSCAVAPDGSHVAVGGRSGALRIWSLHGGAERLLQGDNLEERQARAARLSGRLVASSVTAGAVASFLAMVWLPILALLCLCGLVPMLLGLSAAATMSDGNVRRLRQHLTIATVATAAIEATTAIVLMLLGTTGRVEIFRVILAELLSGALVGIVAAVVVAVFEWRSWRPGPVKSLAFSPNADALCVGTQGGTVQLLSPTTGHLIAILGVGFRQSLAEQVANAADLGDLDFGPERDGVNGCALLSSAAARDTVAATTRCMTEPLLWRRDAAGRYEECGRRPAVGLRRRARASTGALCLAASPCGERLATGMGDGRLHLWDGARGEHLAPLEGGHAAGAAVRGCAFSPDGRLLVSAGTDGQLVVWDVERRLPGHRYIVGWPLETVCWAADGRTIGAGDAAGQVYLLRLEMGMAP
jgi:WD40 repeat protein